MMICFGLANTHDSDRSYLVGLMPLFIGLALLVHAYLLAPKE